MCLKELTQSTVLETPVIAWKVFRKHRFCDYLVGPYTETTTGKRYYIGKEYEASNIEYYNPLVKSTYYGFHAFKTLEGARAEVADWNRGTASNTEIICKVELSGETVEGIFVLTVVGHNRYMVDRNAFPCLASHKMKIIEKLK